MTTEKTAIQMNHPALEALAQEMLGVRQGQKAYEKSGKTLRAEIDKYLEDVDADIITLGNGIQIDLVKATRKGSIDPLELKKLGLKPEIIDQATKPSSTSIRMELTRLEDNG